MNGYNVDTNKPPRDWNRRGYGRHLLGGISLDSLPFYVPLSRSDKFAIVDIDDYLLVSNQIWYCGKNKSGRSLRYFAACHAPGNGPVIMMHRVIMNAQQGEFVDHINHDALDNRRSNLRLCSAQQNQWNRKVSTFRAIPYKGVAQKRDRFIARIYLDGIPHYLGTFYTAHAAAAAYNDAALQHFGEFACLNPLPEKTDGES